MNTQSFRRFKKWNKWRKMKAIRLLSYRQNVFGWIRESNTWNEKTTHKTVFLFASFPNRNHCIRCHLPALKIPRRISMRDVWEEGWRTQNIMPKLESTFSHHFYILLQYTLHSTAAAKLRSLTTEKQWKRQSFNVSWVVEISYHLREWGKNRRDERSEIL